MRVCIDPGHGGIDRANRGAGGYVEADGVLDIALRVRKLLVSLGVEVMMTRDSDCYVSLADRVRSAAIRGADCFISIHTDAAASSEAHGFAVFYSSRSEASEKLARSIEQRMRAAGRTSRGARTRQLSDGRDYYYVVREAAMPAVLVECAFHSNPEEEALLQTAEFRQTMAQEIAQGIWRHLTGQEQDQVAILLDGVLLSVAGQLVDGTTLVPLRALAEALGMTIFWDADKRAVRMHSLR